MNEDENFPRAWGKLWEKTRALLDGFPGGHDFDHTLRVLRTAERLAKAAPGAALPVVRLSALLHDIARPEEEASRGTLCHAKLGAEKALSWMLEAGIPENIARAAANCIRTHRWRGDERPEGLEAEILFDADKLDSLGACGIGRAFLFAGNSHARLHNLREEALAGKPYGREDSAYREYLVKLRRLPDGMLTAPGRAEGRERLAFMHAFFERLNQEIYATALPDEEL